MMKMNQKSGTTDLQTEPDLLDRNSHIWITEKSRFIYRTLVQGDDFLNGMSYMLSCSDQKYHILPHVVLDWTELVNILHFSKRTFKLI